MDALGFGPITIKHMQKKYPLPIPAIRILRKLGSDINDARRRRRIPIALMAERAGLSKTTVGSIEKGDPATAIGSYTAVLFVLGMAENMGSVVDAAQDALGRQLEDERLPKRIRLPKKDQDHA